jgi:hypothetical protein
VSNDSPFDTLGAQPEYSDEDKAQFDRLDYLWHQTFAQTDSGRELLEILSKRIMTTPAANQANDIYHLGYRDGRDDFIKYILMTIEKVENQ